MSAFSEGMHEVTAKHIRTAAVDSDFMQRFNWKPYAWGSAMAASLCVAVWAGMLLSAGQAQTPVMAEATTTEVNYEQLLAHSPQAADHGAVEAQQVSDLISIRLGDTRDWLVKVPDNHYSIQLFMARTVDADAVEQFLRQAPEMLDFEKIYIYETVINGRPMYSVLYDEYSSRQTARSTLKNLPAELQASKPYLRRVSALRKDLVANDERRVALQG